MPNVSNELVPMNRELSPQVLVGLLPKDYEHDYDGQAMANLKAIPVLGQVVNWFIQWTQVKWDIVDFCGSSFQITSASCNDLFNLLRKTSETLDLKPIPPMYIQEHYDINAFTIGHNEGAYMIFNSGAVDKLNDKELMFVIGHEMGHIKSGHVLYQSVATYLNTLIKQIPIVGGVGAAVLRVPIEKWRRMAEFTADRAGLLACQDIDSAVSAIMKMSGLPERYYDKASIEGYIAQVNDFKMKHQGNIIATLMNMKSTHPWNVLRVAELIDWHKSGEYGRVLNNRHGKRCPIHGGYLPLETKVCPFDGYRWE